MTELICIKSFNNRAEAELARGLLETQGVEAIVYADDAGGMRPHLMMGMGGARLMVIKNDEKRAKNILSND